MLSYSPVTVLSEGRFFVMFCETFVYDVKGTGFKRLRWADTSRL